MSTTERVSSRLLKKEQKKLLKQTIWFVGGGIALVAAFIFFVLPNFISLANSVLDTNPIVEDETVILQAPVLVAPVTATFSAELEVSGVSQAGMKNVFVVNGSAGPEAVSKEDGTFSSKILLTDGENSFSAYAVDDKGNESPASRAYVTILDNHAPTLEITEPQDKQEFDEKHKLITIQGKTEPNVKLYINDRFFLPRADGSYSTTFSLAGGENKLIIKAIDQAGNQTQIERIVQLKS